MQVLIAPLAALPFWAIVPFWVVGGVMAFWFAVMMRAPKRDEWTWVIALALSPVMIINIGLAQNGGYSALMFIAGFLILDRRPMLAGLLFGLLTVKPQIGLLIPFELIILGAWRAFWTAAVVTIVLFLASILLFGTGPWHGFLTETLRVQAMYLDDPYGPVS
ncbi:MAG: glycosyltransferase family 87 protein [Pseudomonadota bacterium]